MKLTSYVLIDTNTDTKQSQAKLTAGEVSILNYAYALNGSSLRWQKQKFALSSY